MTIAVVDRVGNVLALYRKPTAPPENDRIAVGLARTAAFFSNNQAPLSSRTVRFISGINFPPGVMNTPNAALYGIENTNRGCDLNVTFNAGKDVPRARSPAGIRSDLPCNAFDTSGCGTGPLTGKADSNDSQPAAVNPGGVPIFRFGSTANPGLLLGGVGVAGIDPSHAEYVAFRAPFSGNGTAPVPQFPLPEPRNVFIDGIRLPFVEQVVRPPDLVAGVLDGAYDPAFNPRDGQAAPGGYLVGPIAGGVGGLTAAEVDQIVQQSVEAANRTRAVIRLPLGNCSKMIIAVADIDGTLLAIYRMPDATLFSLDVAATKARNVVYFSGPGSVDLRGIPPGTAVSNRTISFGAQPLFPPGIPGPDPGPFFSDVFERDLANPCSQASQPPSQNQSGIVFFPGSTPLYRDNVMVGGLGISGDGVEQDDYVSFLGAEGYLPDPAILANQIFIDGVRMPFLKFPRNPEACRP